MGTSWEGSNSDFGIWLAWCQWRVQHRFDNFIVITGYEGIGKSTAAAFLGTLLDPHLSSDAIAWDAVRFLEIFIDADRPGMVVWWDEAIEGAYSKDAMTRINKILGKVLTRVRAKRLNMIVCIPNLGQLDNQIVRRATTWIHVEERGLMEFYKPRRSKFKSDKPWMDKRFEVSFPPMPPGIEDLYNDRKFEEMDKALVRSLHHMKGDQTTEEARDKTPSEIWEEIRGRLKTEDRDAWISSRGTLRMEKVTAEFGISQHRAREVKALGDPILSREG